MALLLNQVHSSRVNIRWSYMHGFLSSGLKIFFLNQTVVVSDLIKQPPTNK